MKTVEHYTFSDSRRKLDITVALMVNDSCEGAEVRHELVTKAAVKAVGRHVERRADMLREDMAKHDLSVSAITRDFERELDLRSPKILRCIAVEIAEAIGDMCNTANGTDAETLPELGDVKLDGITVEAQPLVKDAVGTTLEVQILF